MSGLSFVPLGVGDAFSAKYYSSCIAVCAEGRWLLIDCPHPIRKMLREASESLGIELDVGSFEAVAITHLHADHCSGLEGYGYFSHFALKRSADLLIHPRVSEELWSGNLSAGMRQLRDADGCASAMGLGDYFSVQELSEEHSVELGPFRIECRLTKHHIATTAFRITAGGSSLGYSADTCFDPALIDWLAQSDLVVHETNLGTHTPYERLAELPQDLRERMRLIHFPDHFDGSASCIEVLEQGKRYAV